MEKSLAGDMVRVFPEKNGKLMIVKQHSRRLAHKARGVVVLFQKPPREFSSLRKTPRFCFYEKKRGPNIDGGLLNRILAEDPPLTITLLSKRTYMF